MGLLFLFIFCPHTVKQYYASDDRVHFRSPAQYHIKMKYYNIQN